MTLRFAEGFGGPNPRSNASAGCVRRAQGACKPIWTSLHAPQPLSARATAHTQTPTSPSRFLSQVYEFASLLEDGGSGGAHYPVLDLPFRAKLAAVTWNTYLKSHLLAADYAGIATLVDASAGVEVNNYAICQSLAP